MICTAPSVTDRNSNRVEAVRYGSSDHAARSDDDAERGTPRNPSFDALYSSAGRRADSRP